MAMAVEGALDTVFPPGKEEVTRISNKLRLEPSLEVAQQGLSWVAKREKIWDQARYPWQILGPMEKAGPVVAAVHRNAYLLDRLLKASTRDQRAGKLAADLATGGARALLSAVALYHPWTERVKLWTESAKGTVYWAERELKKSEIKANQVLGMALSVEWGLIKTDMLFGGRWCAEEMVRNLQELSEQASDTHPDLVTTTATKVIAWSIQRGQGDLGLKARQVLNPLVREDGYLYADLIISECTRIRNRDHRNALSYFTALVSPLNPSFNKRRQALARVLR